jgi:hypothetical protein
VLPVKTYNPKTTHTIHLIHIGGIQSQTECVRQCRFGRSPVTVIALEPEKQIIISQCPPDAFFETFAVKVSGIPAAHAGFNPDFPTNDLFVPNAAGLAAVHASSKSLGRKFFHVVMCAPKSARCSPLLLVGCSNTARHPSVGQAGDSARKSCRCRCDPSRAPARSGF